MTTTIAISGKGGTGKTTLSALTVRALMEEAVGSILAVDADPNSCLGLMMGAEVLHTIAEIREQARSKTPSQGNMDRVRTFEYGIQQVISEQKGYDLLTMGRPEGPDCYCAANNLLRKFMDQLNQAYRFVVLDNEAGMEHLSRRTTNHVDLLCIVSDPNAIGRITAKRIFDLTKTLPIEVKRVGIVWNRAEEELSVDGIASLGWVPYDESAGQVAQQNKTIFDLEKNSPALAAMRQIVARQLHLEPVTE